MTKTWHVKSQLKQKKTCLKKYCNILSSPFRTSQKIVSNLNFSDINSKLEGPLALRSESFVPSCDPEGNRDSTRVGSLALFWMGGTELHGGWFILMCTKSWCKFCIEATKETLCLDTLHHCLNWLFIHSIHLMATKFGSASLPTLESMWAKVEANTLLTFPSSDLPGKKWPSRSIQFQTSHPEDLRPTPVFFGKLEGKWFFFGWPFERILWIPRPSSHQAIKMRKWISLAVILW